MILTAFAEDAREKVALAHTGIDAKRTLLGSKPRPTRSQVARTI